MSPETVLSHGRHASSLGKSPSSNSRHAGSMSKCPSGRDSAGHRRASVKHVEEEGSAVGAADQATPLSGILNGIRCVCFELAGAFKLSCSNLA